VRLPSPRSLVPPLAATLVVVAGAAVLWSGLSRTAVLGGDAPIVGRLPAVTAPVVVTAPGMSELSGGEFTVTATGPGEQRVFVGVGRADDVEAYLGGVARAEITALEPDGRMRVATRDGDPSLPDPAGVDVWAAAAQGTGTATLNWPRAPGSWRVVVAVDGRTAPSSAQFTWAGSSGSSGAPALIAVGAVLLVAGLAGLLAIRSGRLSRRAQAREPERAGSRARGAAAETARGGEARGGQARAGEAAPDPAYSPRRAAAAARGEPARSGRRSPGAGGERATGSLRLPRSADRPPAGEPVATPSAGVPVDVDLRGTERRGARRDDRQETDRQEVDLRPTDPRPPARRDRGLFDAGPGDRTDDPDEDAGDETVLIQPFRHRRPGRRDEP